jgi:hypothetical protein
MAHTPRARAVGRLAILGVLLGCLVALSSPAAEAAMCCSDCQPELSWCLEVAQGDPAMVSWCYDRYFFCARTCHDSWCECCDCGPNCT